MKMKDVHIQGVFTIDVSREEFEAALEEWLEKQGWGFLGLTSDYKEKSTH